VSKRERQRQSPLCTYLSGLWLLVAETDDVKADVELFECRLDARDGAVVVESAEQRGDGCGVRQGVKGLHARDGRGVVGLVPQQQPVRALLVGNALEHTGILSARAAKELEPSSAA
jgi:hypothetical protein